MSLQDGAAMFAAQQQQRRAAQERAAEPPVFDDYLTPVQPSQELTSGGHRALLRRLRAEKGTVTDG